MASGDREKIMFEATEKALREQATKFNGLRPAPADRVEQARWHEPDLKKKKM